jgi:hypothetical protein
MGAPAAWGRRGEVLLLPRPHAHSGRSQSAEGRLTVRRHGRDRGARRHRRRLGGRRRRVAGEHAERQGTDVRVEGAAGRRLPAVRNVASGQVVGDAGELRSKGVVAGEGVVGVGLGGVDTVVAGVELVLWQQGTVVGRWWTTPPGLLAPASTAAQHRPSPPSSQRLLQQALCCSTASNPSPPATPPLLTLLVCSHVQWP